MRSLIPDRHDHVDASGEIAAEPRGHDDRPWLLVNMVASLDGATAVTGRSGPLGGPGDRLVFGALRAIADIVLVAAGTVRAENYGPPRLPEDAIEARLERGQSPRPRLAVVTASGDLGADATFFDDDPVPLIITSAQAEGIVSARLSGRAEVVTVGSDRVDFAAALTELGRRGARIVLCEGGPSLNGQLIADDLVDEVNLTIAPLIVGGSSARIVQGATPVDPTRFALERVFEEDGTLFTRYCRH